MEKFLEIEGFDKATVELFETAGFLTPESITVLPAEQVHSELSKANQMLRVAENVPTVEALEALRERLGAGSDAAEQLSAHSVSGEVHDAGTDVALKRSGTTAAALSAEFIAEHAIDLESLPRLLPASEAVVREVAAVAAPVVTLDVALKGEPAEVENISATDRFSTKPGLDEDRIKTFDEFQEEGGNVAPLERNADGDLTKAPKEGTNQGVSPDSRNYLRGVLHKEAGRTLLGSVAFIVSQLLLFLSVVPVVYILMNRDQSVWGLLTPALLFLSGIVYIALARQTACPVCRQRQFVAKACRKHVKAHRWPVVGHMLPTAVHIVLFKWFRCIFCGTSIRVKE